MDNTKAIELMNEVINNNGWIWLHEKSAILKGIAALEAVPKMIEAATRYEHIGGDAYRLAQELKTIAGVEV